MIALDTVTEWWEYSTDTSRTYLASESRKLSNSGFLVDGRAGKSVIWIKIWVKSLHFWEQLLPGLSQIQQPVLVHTRILQFVRNCDSIPGPATRNLTDSRKRGHIVGRYTCNPWSRCCGMIKIDAWNFVQFPVQEWWETFLCCIMVNCHVVFI